MSKLTKSDLIVLAILLFIVVGFGVSATQNMKLRGDQQELVNKIQYLNREIGEYKAREDFYWDFADLLDEIYDVKIKEAVLQERVKWLKEYQEPIVSQQQMYDDFEELIEIIIYYYEHTDQVVAWETYVETNYPELYERLLEY